VRRAVVVIGVAVVVAFALLVAISLHVDEEAASITIGSTACVRARQVVLTAQSVPGASLVPCLTADATRWEGSTSSFTSEGTSMTLRNQTVLEATWQMQFDPACAPAAGATRTTEQVGGIEVTTSVVAGAAAPRGTADVAETTWSEFPGGCVTTIVTVPGNLDRRLILDETDSLLVLLPRTVLAADVQQGNDGRLSL
jgi:hypothetical protein